MILINDSIPATRKRFTLAHEMGHRILGHTGAHFSFSGSVFVLDSETENEKAANRLAAELLMPEDFILRDRGRFTLAQMTRRYFVSKEAMLYRLEQ